MTSRLFPATETEEERRMKRVVSRRDSGEKRVGVGVGLKINEKLREGFEVAMEDICLNFQNFLVLGVA